MRLAAIAAIVRLASPFALSLSVGCSHSLETESLGALDVEGYALEVQGVLEPSCATLDCHGDIGRPLRLYAETGLRAPGVRRDAPLTPEELEDNVRSLLAIDPGTEPGANLVITKPLSTAVGGEAHVGGDVWPDREDPAVICVTAWLAGDVSSEREACATARAAVALPPEMRLP